MKRSKFNLSYTHLFSCDMGELIPAGLLEVLPGDTVQLNSAALVRCAPMLAPPMHPVSVRIHHWFVPLRLIWTDFEDFITGGPDGNNASVYPTRTPGSSPVGSVGDYLGIPVGLSGTLPLSALPYRAYNLIWNEWYRDQDLQAEVAISLASGNDTTTVAALQTCAWEKDYFTSARPWEQKGPAVSIPATGLVEMSETGATPGTRTMRRQAATGSQPAIVQEAGTSNAVLQWNLTGGQINVNALRQGLAIQRFEEARARYGSRYVEYLRALGVRSSDARLSRPEYLGGGRSTIQFSEVLQSAADGANPVSTMRGHGISAQRSNTFRRFIEEHGYIMTMLSVLPKTMYNNGLARHWNRRTKLDFWQRELQHIGQQPVLNKEVYAIGASPDGTFGWQDRYDEYRRSWSRVSGEFRTSTLNFWHFARDFASAPALNAAFVAAVPPERPFAVPANDVLYIQMKHNCVARRLVAKTGTSYIF